MIDAYITLSGTEDAQEMELLIYHIEYPHKESDEDEPIPRLKVE